MSSSRSVPKLALLLAIFCLACGVEPIPRIAVAGTTIAIPFPNAFAAFGRVLSSQWDPATLNAGPVPINTPFQPGSDLEDVQRGELVFELHKLTGGTTFVTYLPVRFITRVHLDEGSRAASPAAGEPVDGASFEIGQPLAFVDIPPGVPADDYRIKVRRYRRDLSQNAIFVPDQPTVGGDPWIGWGTSDPEVGIPIRIVASDDPGGDGSFSLPEEAPWGWGLFFGEYDHLDIASDLQETVPRPQLSILAAQTDPPPAAMEFEIQYPRANAEILGVSLARNHRSSALAVLTPDAVGPTSCATGGTGVVKVTIVDPDEIAYALRVAYRVHNLDQSACRKRLTLADFSIPSESVRSFDRDGVPIIGGTPPTIINVSF